METTLPVQDCKEQIDFQERVNTGSSSTGHIEFDKNGYIVIRGLYDAKELYCEPPKEKGQYNYFGKIEKFTYCPIESQVEGSTSRYYWPPYKHAHSQIRLKIEKILGRRLYNTYYYDRFYNPGQELSYHVDRPACEVSVTVHISSNLEQPWPIWIKTPDSYDCPLKKQVTKKGESHYVILNSGDGMIYKGCERPHWRYPMPCEHRRLWYGRMVEKENLYYHQVFFHYVLADGLRVEYANDAIQ